MKNVGHLAIVRKEPINTDGVMGIINDESGESIAMLAVSVNRHGGHCWSYQNILGWGTPAMAGILHRIANKMMESDE